MTLETEFIKYGVFIVYFCNTSLLYIFAPWDSRETDSPALNRIFQGVYTDYNSNWFNDIGNTLAQTMFLNIFSPVIETFAFTGLRFAKRIVDQRKLLVPISHSAPFETKAKTLQGFQELYQGPVFMFHYKYSFIMNITFVTFIFGSSMPILFPMAWLSMFVYYTQERMRMAYSYAKPPMYDSTMNQTTLLVLLVAPWLYVLSAAWTFSNQQVFMDVVPVNTGVTLYNLADHRFVYFLTQLTPATPFVVIAAGAVIFLVVLPCYR